MRSCFISEDLCLKKQIGGRYLCQQMKLHTSDLILSKSDANYSVWLGTEQSYVEFLKNKWYFKKKRKVIWCTVFVVKTYPKYIFSCNTWSFYS